MTNYTTLQHQLTDLPLIAAQITCCKVKNHDKAMTVANRRKGTTMSVVTGARK